MGASSPADGRSRHQQQHLHHDHHRQLHQRHQHQLQLLYCSHHLPLPHADPRSLGIPTLAALPFHGQAAATATRDMALASAAGLGGAGAYAPALLSVAHGFDPRGPFAAGTAHVPPTAFAFLPAGFDQAGSLAELNRGDPSVGGTGSNRVSGVGGGCVDNVPDACAAGEPVSNVDHPCDGEETGTEAMIAGTAGGELSDVTCGPGGAGPVGPPLSGGAAVQATMLPVDSVCDDGGACPPRT
jgi:hypothetical protein